MRCNQELYGHITCDRDVIAGEKYCKFHFVPFLRIQIEKLQAENANFLSKINLALFIMKDNEWHNDEGSVEYQVYKILEKAIEEL